MHATRSPLGRLVALLALTSCDGTTPPEPWPPAALVLEAVTPGSATGIVGEELDQVPVVVVLGNGRPVKGIQVSFVASGSGFAGSTTVMTDAAGLATPGSWRLGPGAGPQTLTAHAAEHSLVFTADAQPGPITNLAVVDGNHQRAAGGTPLSVPLRVKATDQYGNVVTGGAVTFAVVDGGGSLEPGVSITRSDGIAESMWTLGTTAGRQHVRAETGAEATAQFTADACQPSKCSFELTYSLNGNVLIFDGATGGIRQLTTYDDHNLLLTPEWSSDGQRIAFTRYTGVGGPGWSSPPATADVYVMNADGIGVTRVTGNTAGSLVWSHSPTWSPRGDAIAFSGDRGRCMTECGALGIYVQELREGSVPRSVALGFSPAWSPDGSRIAFIGLTEGDYPGSLGLVNPDGSGLTEVPLAAGGLLDGPSWSPDGTRIAFSKCGQSGCEIYVVRPDGSGLSQLTTSVPDCSWCGAVTPAWSPDGTRIAYTAVRYNEAGTTLGRIMEIPADGGEPMTLVDAGWSPSWRPAR